MQTIILGFDSFDPVTFERLSSSGKMPNLRRFVEAGKYARFTVSDPPQTEVSWTSIATGLDPGGHGIFDFVHRDPATYTPFVSILPTKRTAVGIQFVPPYQARTIFEEATRMGYPATSLWWPATFPARPELPIQSIPGLGTPDILGKLGVGSLFSDAPGPGDSTQKTQTRSLQPAGKNRWKGSIEGPVAKKDGRAQSVTADLQLELDGQEARLLVGSQAFPIQVGKWSPVLEISFKMGFLMSVKAVTRAILTQVEPHIRLYFLPLQIHPLASPWRYATPPGFVKQLWNASGPHLTLGWPQDTTGLEESHISDDQFLDLCQAIFTGRERALMHQVGKFREGILGVVFDDLDRVQHMFRRDRMDIVEEWYARLDALVGRVESQLASLDGGKLRLFVLSDHGFQDFTYKVHLNRWLLDHGYLTSTSNTPGGSLNDMDWSRSQVYAVGLNSLYVNLAGREGQGSVPPDQAGSLVAKVKDQLLDWKGPDGRPVVQRAMERSEVFSGPMTPYGPDLLVGYSPAYRASSETGLGKWAAESIELNRDHWGADHCIDSISVPGVIFASAGLGGRQNPSFRDIPRMTLGKDIEQEKSPPPPPSTTGGEDQDILEERLKGLGYL